MKESITFNKEDIKVLKGQIQEASISNDLGRKHLCLRFINRFLDIKLEGGNNNDTKSVYRS